MKWLYQAVSILCVGAYWFFRVAFDAILGRDEEE